MPYLLFLKKQLNLKLSAAAIYRWNLQMLFTVELSVRVLAWRSKDGSVVLDSFKTPCCVLEQGTFFA